MECLPACMKNLLCVETATDVSSIALLRHDGKIFVDEHSRKNSHTETITLQIKKCLELSGLDIEDLDVIGVSCGPGSYTGLRVGASAVKGVAYGAEIPVITLNTLRGLAKGVAESAEPGDLIVPMIDARRMEVYYCAYDGEMQEVLTTTNRIVNDYFLNEMACMGNIIVCGNGAWKLKHVNSRENIRIMDTRCSALHLLEECRYKFFKNEFADLAYFEPDYFKSPNITQPAKRIL